MSADLMLNKHRAWKSTSRAEDYIDDNLHSEDKTDALPKTYKNERSTNNNLSSLLVSHNFNLQFL